MTDIALLKVENVALNAENKAADAKHIAEKAVMQQSAHEAICSERYATIHSQLAALVGIYESLNELRAVANKAIGMWLGLTGLAVVIGGVYTMVKLSSGG